MARSNALTRRSLPTPTLPPGVPALTSTFWSALSAIRGARIFHPNGVAYRGTFEVPEHGGSSGVPLFDQPGRHEATIRFSRGAGLPQPLPDLLGLALRIEDAHGRARPQDFLLITSRDAPIVHHALLPARSFFGGSYSSILAYRIGSAVRLVGAIPTIAPDGAGRHDMEELVERADAGEVSFHLALAPLLGRWRRIGELRVEERLSDTVAEELRYNPWNAGGGIVPVGPFQGLRRPAYAGSQRGRAA